jgi:gas vesicle protein
MSDNAFSVRREQVKGFVTGLLLGGAFGAGAALLNAPRSGKKTRKQIQDQVSSVQSKAEQSMQEVRDRAQETRQQVAQRAEEARSRIQEASNGIAKRTEELKELTDAAVEQGKQSVSDGAEAVEKATKNQFFSAVDSLVG